MSLRSLLLLLLPFTLCSCFLGPEPTPEPVDTDKPQFEEEYYQGNARDYFHNKHYARARQQWSTVLDHFNPDDWLAKLGVASCDYFMGSDRLDRGDLKNGREQLQRSEQRLREIWNGSIEKDTLETLESFRPQWRAAMILGLTLRALGDADHLQALRLSQQILTLKPGAPESQAMADELEVVGKRKQANYTQALSLFTRLASMENASPDAILNRAELRQRMGQMNAAEQDFNDYLRMAQKSLENHYKNRQAAIDTTPSPNTRKELLAIWDEKIASAKAKQTGILLRLGNMFYDEGIRAQDEAKLLAPPADKLKLATSRDSFARALRYLESARHVSPDKADILVKLAQVEGELGNFETALTNLNSYISEVNLNPETEWDNDLDHAFRLKAEFERRLDAKRRP